MAVLISLLRGINVGGHHQIRMDALRKVYESLDLREAQTYLQSGNVIFKSSERNLIRLAARIEDALEQTFDFRPAVMIRTGAELRDVVARNPFATRTGIEPAKLAVSFLADEPDEEARRKFLGIKTDPEELRMSGREIYIYFPNGMGRSKLPWPAIGKALKTSGTARNWNTVLKLTEAAEMLAANRNKA